MQSKQRNVLLKSCSLWKKSAVVHLRFSSRCLIHRLCLFSYIGRKSGDLSFTRRLKRCICLKASAGTPNAAAYGDLGRFPLHISSMLRCVKYWFKLLKQPENMYSKKAYLMLLGRHEKGKITCRSGFGHVWMFGCGDERIFLRSLKQRLQDCFVQEWFNQIKNSDRYIFYKCFKSSLEREKYIEILVCVNYRCATSRFRMGVSVLMLNAHRFRYSSLPARRACPFCPENVIEDELHFLYIFVHYTQTCGWNTYHLLRQETGQVC